MNTTGLYTVLLTLAMATAACAQGDGVGTYDLEGALNPTEGGKQPATVKVVIKKTGEDTYEATRTMTFTGERDRRLDSISWVSTEVTVSKSSSSSWRSEPGGRTTVTVIYRLPTQVPAERPEAETLDADRGLIAALEGGGGPTHTVVSGDWLSRIARRYGTTVKALTDLNGLTSTVIRPGQVLKLPAPPAPEPAEPVEPEMVDAENIIESTLKVTDGVSVTERLSNRERLAPEDGWRDGQFRGLLQGDSSNRLRLGHPLGVKRNKTLTLVIPTDGELTLTTTSGRLVLKNRFGAEMTPSSDTKYEIEASALGTYSVVVEGPSLATVKATFLQKGATDERIKDWGGSIWGLAEWSSYSSYKSGSAPSSSRLYSEGGPLDRFDSAFGLTARSYGSPKMSAAFWERGGDGPRPYERDLMKSGHYTRFSSLDESMAEIAWHFDFNGDGRETSRYQELQVVDGRIVPMDPAGAVGARIRKRTNTEKVENSGDGTLFHTDASVWRIYRVNKENSDRQVFYANHNPGSNTISFYRSSADRAHGIAAIDSQGMGGIAAIATITNPRPFATFDVRGPNRLRIQGKLGAMLEPGQMARVYGGDWTDQYDWDGNKSRQDSISRGWYGHCNSKSIASSFFREPKAGTFKGIEFRVSDLKGILSEYAMGTVQRTGLSWGKNLGVGRDRTEYAKQFHELLYKWLRIEKNSVWGDHTLRKPGETGGSVWNYVISKYSSEMVEAEGGDPYVLDVNTSTGSNSRSSTYVLHFNRYGRILGGANSKTEWTNEKWWRYVYHTTDITYSFRNRNRAVTPDRLRALFEGLGGLKFQDIDEIEIEREAAEAAEATRVVAEAAEAEAAEAEGDDSGQAEDDAEPATAEPATAEPIAVVNVSGPNGAR